MTVLGQNTQHCPSEVGYGPILNPNRFYFRVKVAVRVRPFNQRYFSLDCEFMFINLLRHFITR